MQKLFFSVLIPAFLMLFTGCDSGNNTGSPVVAAEKSRLKVLLTDSPGDYEAVLIDIKDIQVNANTDTNTEQGWISLSSKQPGIYDLLKLTNGIDTLLAQDELTLERVAQLRLVLGTRNSVKVDGKTYSLQTPGAMQSGLKLNINAELQGGVIYAVLLDFDAGRSIVKAGNSGRYQLKPVLRVISEARTGAIKGKIIPAEALPVIWAISSSDSVSTYTDTKGHFLLRGLAPGSYQLVIQPKAPYQEKKLDHITVSLGLTSDLKNITLLK